MRHFIGTVLCVLALVCSAAAQQFVDRVAAVVNGEVITMYEVNERAKAIAALMDGGGKTPGKGASAGAKMPPDLQRKVLDLMIDDVLIRQEAERLKVTVSEGEVDARLRQMMEAGKLNDKQLDEQLAAEGFTRKSFLETMRKEMLKQRLIGSMVERKVLVTDSELKSGGVSSSSSSSAPAAASATAGGDGAKISMIVLPKSENAAQIRKQIADGKMTFADAARRYSIGPASDRGGEIGFLAYKDMAPAIRAAVKTLAPGSVSEPLSIDGKMVLVVAGAPEKGAAAASSASSEPVSVRNEDYERIFLQKRDKQYQEYLSKLRTKAVVEVKM